MQVTHSNPVSSVRPQRGPPRPRRPPGSDHRHPARPPPAPARARARPDMAALRSRTGRRGAGNGAARNPAPTLRRSPGGANTSKINI